MLCGFGEAVEEWSGEWVRGAMEVDVSTGDKGGGGVNGGRSYGFEHFGLGALANVLGFVFLFLFEFLFFYFFTFCFVGFGEGTI